MLMLKSLTGMEILVIAIIALIVVVIAAGAITGGIDLSGTGDTSTQCIGGYLFTKPVSYDFKHPVTPVQVLDEQGHGIKCGNR